jgi:glycogen operon protein
MILGGDELSHTQKGNNNTYCQDNDLTWLHWELDEQQQQFLAFVKKVIRVWGTQPVFQRRQFFKGRAIRGTDIKDISFLNPAGQEMTDEDWNSGLTKCMGVRLAGDLINDQDERGEAIIGDTLLLLLNAHHEPISFTLPLTKIDQLWEQILDTAEDAGTPTVLKGQEQYSLKDRSLVILRTRGIDETSGEHSSAQVEAVLRASQPPLAGRPPLD